MFSLDDVKYAFRLLKKQPLFSFLAIVVLAGGLALSLYTFALLQTALYKDLPLPDGERVVTVRGKSATGSDLFTFEIQQIRSRVTRIEELSLYRVSSATLNEQDVSRTVSAAVAESSIFEFTRTLPLMGRGLLPADSIDGAEPVAVIGHGLWQSHFAGDPAILERVVHVNNVPRRIVGVMPDGYAFPVRSQMWLPLSRREMNAPAYAGNGGLPEVISAYGRLRPGVTAEEATEELNVLLRDLRQQHPRRENDGYRYDGFEVMTFQRAYLGSGGLVLFAVLNLVAIAILLLACANVGNMLLARTNERSAEIAVRVALGAPRWRLMSQMTLESMIICVLGGGIALLLAGWGLRATNRILHSLNQSLPYWMHWGLDARAIAASVVFVLLAVVLVAALPILSASSVPSASLLREGTRGAQGRASGRITRFLVTLQIVLISLVMVAGGALTVIARRFVDIDFGINTDRLLLLVAMPPDEITKVPMDQIDGWVRRNDQRTLAALRAEPTIDAVMMWTHNRDANFAIDNGDSPNVADFPEASVVVSSDGPVQLGGKLLEGRYFDHRETAGGTRSVLVSKTLATTYWPGTSPIGRSIRIIDDEGKRGQPLTVIGVVSDVLDPFRVLQVDRRAYTCLVLPPTADRYKTPGEFLVRHHGNEEETRRAVQRIVEGLGGTLAQPVVPYGEELRNATRLASTMTDAFEAAGLFALLLGLTGIYGLCRNEVVRRTQEIGLRRAVGASERSILQLLLRQSVRRLLIGLLLGATLSVIALFALLKFAAVGVPTLFVIALTVAATISLLVASASYFSTRGVLRGEPAEALRYE
ncbi:MAG TPA: ABC transporter permease [Thermoanaerobaculia bacterium]|nr:ABC transporter permease [Thermoanaerobaculia bacterium]